VFGGIGAIIFYLLLDFATSIGLRSLVPVPLAGGEAPVFPAYFNVPSYILPLVAGIGGLISGIIVFKLAPETEGHGTDQVIEAFHRRGGVIRKRVPFIKTIASAITIGSGGSAGREGPIAQIGAGLSSILGSYLNLSERDRRIMVMCGAAAGIGSIFKAPLGGAIFGIEVLYKRDFEFEALVPAFISSIIAYTIFSSFFGWNTAHIFKVPEMAFTNPLELNLYASLGIISGLVAVLYVKIFYGIRNFFRKFNAPPYLKPFIGGLLVGVGGIFFPQILGVGYGWVQKAIDGQMLITTMFIVAFLKILATSFTVSSGGSGGVFAPSLVVGAMLGGGFGYMLSNVMPSMVVYPSAYVLVGMAAVIASVAKVPVAAIIMVSEMTGGYGLLPPLMLASALAYVVSGSFTIYEKQVESRLQSPVHRREMTVDVLEQIRVREAMNMDVVTLNPETTVSEVLDIINRTGHIGYPVVENGKLVGIVTFEDAEKVPVEMRDSTLVEKIMSTNLVTVYPDETLEEALNKLVSHNIGRLPVVNRDNDQKLIGILTKSDIIRAHARYGIGQELERSF